MRTAALALVVYVVCGLTATSQAKLVACVGDSITYGSGIANRTVDSYPAQLQRILRQYDLSWEVQNFGVSGATLLSRGDLPYIRQAAFANAQACNPDIVVIKLGTNDSKPQNWQYKSDFIRDYENMIDTFRSLPSQPQVWICKPVPAFYVNFNIRPEVIRDEILPLIDQIAREKNAPVIDLYTALQNSGHLFPDGIHPNAEGAGLMAQAIVPLLLGVRLLPDFERDGVVNFVDFARLALFWRQNDPSFDVAPVPNGDGLIDHRDLGGFVRFWMAYPGMIAHWKFDEAEGEVAHDTLGRLTGAAHGSPAWQPGEGRIGGALSFDGVDDYVGTPVILNPGAGPFSVFVWVKGDRPGQAILSQSNKTGTGEVWLGTDAATGAVMTRLTDGSRITQPLLSAAVITDGAWHSLRLVWDGSGRHLYVDGQEVAADKRKLNALKSSDADFYIGAGKDLEAASFWGGLIDDLRVYGRALIP
ncbi:MAG: GDSL-type esterase/lipase family protein [Planctomycetes bacterium]|nr:GDSL-type esterase/lipase family protein [Planctomycetota bacterium]